MKILIQRIGASILSVVFLYQAYQGFIIGQITIFGRTKSLAITGTACLLASIGATFMGLGSFWRIFTDSNARFLKPFTLKSIPFWFGLILVIIAIFYNSTLN